MAYVSPDQNAYGRAIDDCRCTTGNRPGGAQADERDQRDQTSHRSRSSNISGSRGA